MTFNERVDALIAEHVYGYKPPDLNSATTQAEYEKLRRPVYHPGYSSDIELAWHLLEETDLLNSRCIERCAVSGRYSIYSLDHHGLGCEELAHDPRIEMCICLAVLKTKGINIPSDPVALSKCIHLIGNPETPKDLRSIGQDRVGDFVFELCRPCSAQFDKVMDFRGKS